MNKKRHRWGDVKENKAFMEYQKCINCDLHRVRALGIWIYTKDDPKTLLMSYCENNGCK